MVKYVNNVKCYFILVRKEKTDGHSAVYCSLQGILSISRIEICLATKDYISSCSLLVRIIYVKRH